MNNIIPANKFVTFYGTHPDPHQKGSLIVLQTKEEKSIESIVEQLNKQIEMLDWSFICYKDSDEEVEKESDVLIHNRVVEYSRKIRDTLIELPKGILEEPRSVYAKITCMSKEHYVLCPINCYLAISDAFKEHNGGSDNNMKEMLRICGRLYDIEIPSNENLVFTDKKIDTIQWSAWPHVVDLLVKHFKIHNVNATLH